MLLFNKTLRVLRWEGATVLCKTLRSRSPTQLFKVHERAVDQPRRLTKIRFHSLDRFSRLLS